MNEAIKEYLTREETLSLIDQNMWQELYDDATFRLTAEDVREMTLFLIEQININPVEYMTRIPTDYYSDINIPKIIIPPQIQTIDDNAFTNSNIASLYLPKMLTKLCDESFNDCNIAVVCIPWSIEDYVNTVEADAYAGIYNGAFKLADSNGNIIHDVIITSAVNTTYSHHFQDCISIQTVKFDNGVQAIPHYAFSGCHNLTAIELPKTITSIGEEAFAYCVNLNKIIYEGTKDEFDRITFFPEWLSNGDGTEHQFELVCSDGTYRMEVSE